MALRNAIIDKIAEVADETNSVPTPDDTQTIDAELPAGSRIKKLVVDLFVWKKTDVVLETHPDSWEEGFLRELVVRLKRMNGGHGSGSGGKEEAPWREVGRRCERYHEHYYGGEVEVQQQQHQTCCGLLRGGGGGGGGMNRGGVGGEEVGLRKKRSGERGRKVVYA